MNGKRPFMRAFLLCTLSGMLVPAAHAAESFLEKLLRVSGVSATTSQQRGSEDEAFTGDLMVVDLKENIRRNITSDGGYRSPVFEPGARSILALKGDAVVRISVSGGKGQAVRTVSGIAKLVGFDSSDPDRLLILLEAERNNSAVAFLSLKSGQVTTLPFDRKSEAQRTMLNHLKEWERVYGEVKLYPQEKTKNIMGRTIVWTDVFLQKGEKFPENISNCDGKNCGQPSLSRDRNLIVYVTEKK